MIKNILFFAFSILVGHGLEALEIPLSFHIDKPIAYTIGDDLINIRTDEKSVGLIKRHISGSFLSKRVPQYELYSPEKGIEAVAKVVSTDKKNRVVFSVVDKNEQSLGRIEENWEQNSLLYSPILEIYSPNEELLAIGRWSHRESIFTLIDSQDEHKIVSFKSIGLILISSYTVLIEDPEFRIDSGFLILSLAIASDKRFHYMLLGYKPPSGVEEEIVFEQLDSFEE